MIEPSLSAPHCRIATPSEVKDRASRPRLHCAATLSALQFAEMATGTR